MDDGVSGGKGTAKNADEPEPPDAPGQQPETYSDIFDRLFPEYLMIGMTPEQYWDGEVGTLRAFRKAYIMRIEQEEQTRDTFAWRLGIYFRDALQSTYLMVNGFVPKSARATPYPDQPYTIKEKARREEEKKRKTAEARKKAEEDKIRASMAYFHAAVIQYNKNFRKRQAQKERDAGSEQRAQEKQNQNS